MQQHLLEADSPKVRGRLETLLTAAAKGVANYSTATPEDVLVYVHSALSAAAKAGRAAKQRMDGTEAPEDEEGAHVVHMSSLLQHLCVACLGCLRLAALMC